MIAYRQPVTRAAIEAIRGTSSDGVLATLRARGLVERVGRADGPGRPGLYGTTQRFLEHFGLEQADHLPGLEELAELLGLDEGVQHVLPEEPEPGDAEPEAPSDGDDGDDGHDVGASTAADPDAAVHPPLNL